MRYAIRQERPLQACAALHDERYQKQLLEVLRLLLRDWEERDGRLLPRRHHREEQLAGRCTSIVWKRSRWAVGDSRRGERSNGAQRGSPGARVWRGNEAISEDCRRSAGGSRRVPVDGCADHEKGSCWRLLRRRFNHRPSRSVSRSLLESH